MIDESENQRFCGGSIMQYAMQSPVCAGKCAYSGIRIPLCKGKLAE